MENTILLGAAPFIIGFGVWATKKVYEHETVLAVHSTKLDHISSQNDKQSEKLDKILTVVKNGHGKS